MASRKAPEVSGAADDKLAEYQRMRDFAQTPEPAGFVVENTTGTHRFVVQRHRATRLHYDLRLEIGGVLVSWAVPKGPSLDPKRRNLAVRVEDHPYAYGWFEGNITSGYGKGDVILWDDGWWEPDPEYPGSADATQAVADGELKFLLHGRKLRGRFVIVRTNGDQWLLIHNKDAEAVEGWDPEDHPQSVLSNRTNSDIVAGTPGRWGGPTKSELRVLDTLGEKGQWTVAGETALLTNLDKVFMPGRGRVGEDRVAPITKRDIVRYYAQIAPWMTPYLAGRPVNLNRFPDGIDGAKKGFWHKAVPSHAPPWVRRWPNPRASTGETREYLMIDGAPALVWAANFAGIEIHPWTSTAANPDEPSYALVDIDPGPSTTWDETLTIARLFRVAMQQLDLVARPKVTGQRGIQIWIPVRPGYSFHETSTFIEALSRTVGRVVPELISWQWHKNERRGLARLDYTQNQINKTLVAPYSLRPAPGAPVSVPLEWDELDDPKLRPDRWTIRSVLPRLAKRGDPFLVLAGVEQDLPAL